MEDPRSTRFQKPLDEARPAPQSIGMVDGPPQGSNNLIVRIHKAVPTDLVVYSTLNDPCSASTPKLFLYEGLANVEFPTLTRYRYQRYLFRNPDDPPSGRGARGSSLG